MDKNEQALNDIAGFITKIWICTMTRDEQNIAHILQNCGIIEKVEGMYGGEEYRKVIK
jgi:hypothetical protein